MRELKVTIDMRFPESMEDDAPDFSERLMGHLMEDSFIKAVAANGTRCDIDIEGGEVGDCPAAD